MYLPDVFPIVSRHKQITGPAILKANIFTQTNVYPVPQHADTDKMHDVLHRSEMDPNPDPIPNRMPFTQSDPIFSIGSHFPNQIPFS